MNHQPPLPSLPPDSALFFGLPRARRVPVRLILVAVVFALVLPGLVFCGVLLHHIADTEHMRVREQAQATALRGAEAMDRELATLSTSLMALSTSPALETGDLPALSRQMHALAAAIGQDVVYADPSGQQRINTAYKLGAALPTMGATDTLHQAMMTRAVAVSDLYTGHDGKPTLAIIVPVLRQNEVKGVLAIMLSPAYLTALLRQQNLPPQWIASLTDSTRRVFARSVDAERFLGQYATGDLRAHAIGDNTVWIGKTLEGTPVLAAAQRMRMADWRVSIGVPIAIVEAPLRNTVTLLIITGAATLSLASILAWQLARSVATPLQRLASAADALGRGLPVTGVRSNIAEVDAVSSALVQATRDLRARAEALTAERAQLFAVIETVPVGLVIAEAPSGRIVAANRYLQRMLRQAMPLSPNIAAYAEWPCFNPDGTALAASENPLARVLRGEPQAQMQCLYRRGTNAMRWAQLVAAPIRTADGTITGGVMALLDVDETIRARDAKARFAEELEVQVAERTAALKAANQRLLNEMQARESAEDQLRQSQKMEAVGQLTGGIAHDFNNLLTIIIGSLDLLHRRATDPATSRLLDHALDGATRAATLTSRLLAFSRRQPLLPQEVDVNRLVGSMSDLLHRTLGDDIRVETVLEPGLWPALADPNQLENALLNLAVNARDAMHSAGRAPGHLTIETGNAVLGPAFAAHDPEVQPGDYVRITVTDTGTGMTEEVRARVFEPFYTTKPQGQGTGLGLSQVHGFVKQSGGHVTIETTPGQGTTVALYLPRMTDSPPAAPGRT